mmetsp:Transcript_9785/g.20163  ORF Transcript_9785/g.20163 Transcript_9785/m.20163 type:complete len:239 (+) Transcript_9785:954-1670(+)
MVCVMMYIITVNMILPWYIILLLQILVEKTSNGKSLVQIAITAPGRVISIPPNVAPFINAILGRSRLPQIGKCAYEIGIRILQRIFFFARTTSANDITTTRTGWRPSATGVRDGAGTTLEPLLLVLTHDGHGRRVVQKFFQIIKTVKAIGTFATRVVLFMPPISLILESADSRSTSLTDVDPPTDIINFVQNMQHPMLHFRSFTRKTAPHIFQRCGSLLHAQFPKSARLISRKKRMPK